MVLSIKKYFFYMEISFLLLLSHALKQDGYITNFDKYLLSRNNIIILEMYFLMRYIHEAVYISGDDYD